MPITERYCPKVSWCDGMTVNELHFRRLQEWVEGVIGWRWAAVADSGLARAADEDHINARAAVSIRSSDRGKALVAVEHVRGVTRAGRVVVVEKFEGWVPLPRDAARTHLWLLPRPGAAPEGVSEEPVLEVPQFELVAAADGPPGALAIARVTALKGAPWWAVDREYVPPSVTVRGCESVARATAAIRTGLGAAVAAARGAPVGTRTAEQVVAVWRAMWLALTDDTAAPARFLAAVRFLLAELAHEFRRAGFDADGFDALGPLASAPGDAGDLTDPFARTAAAVEQFRRSCEGQFGPAVEQDNRVEVKRVKRELLAAEGLERVTLVLAAPLREHLDRTGASHLRVRLRAPADADLDGAEVRVHPALAAQSIPVERHHELARDGDGVLFEFAPDRADRDARRVVFYLPPGALPAWARGEAPVQAESF